MSFIIIETFGGAEFAIVVTDEDGENLVFDSFSDAQNEANSCQAGIVIKIER